MVTGLTSGLTSGGYLKGQQIGTQRHQHIVSQGPTHHNI
uniref:Uncharacterized protein n=1 Tax=Klebsiella phage PMBT12 TaxID=3137283 RepID=A0AAU8BUW2_9VIRU